MNIFNECIEAEYYRNEYYRIEKFSLPDKPRMEFSFSDRIEGPYEDAEPFLMI